MKTALKLYAIVIGVVSTIHMVYVFFQESFLGRSATFYEPSIPLAFAEFGMALTGMIVLCIHMIEVIPSPTLVIPKHRLTVQEQLSLIGRVVWK